MSSTITDFGLVSFHEKWLQDLIWNKIEPEDFFQSAKYTKVSMMEQLEKNWALGNTWFLGSKSCGFVYRVFQANDYVIEPHMIGNVGRVRTLQKMAEDWVFTNTSVLKINIYTPYQSILKICERTGYTIEGVIRYSYLRGSTLGDIYLLGLTKDEYMKHKLKENQDGLRRG